MSKLLNTSLTKYDLSEREILSGSVFTQEQKQVLQNLIADASEKKIALKFDPTNTIAFAQEEAELQGQILILKFLLDNSDDNQAELLKLSRDS